MMGLGESKIWKEQQLSVQKHEPLLRALLNATSDADAAATSAQQVVSSKGSDRVGKMIFRHLDVNDILHLRLACKWLREWVRQFHALVFNTLYLAKHFKSPRHEQRALFALASLAPFCRRFVINFQGMLDDGRLLLTNGDEVFAADQSIWMSIFDVLCGLSSIAISAPGKPDWHAFGTGEALLESIRVALETKLPRGLHTITLSPINATGLLHFRWRGAAFQETIWTAQSFWSRIAILHLDLLNPLPHYQNSNKKDFIKTLHDYLGSFNRSLKGLRFSWIGEAGPNPLLLDLRYGGHNFSAPMIVWCALSDVFLRNVMAHDGDLVALRQTRVPHLLHYELEDEEVADYGVLIWNNEEVEETIPRGDSLLEVFGSHSLQ